MNSRIKNAEERVEKAFARIDAALMETVSAQGSNARAEALEKENAILRKQNDEIASGLDTAIDRLQRILQAT